MTAPFTTGQLVRNTSSHDIHTVDDPNVYERHEYEPLDDPDGFNLTEISANTEMFPAYMARVVMGVLAEHNPFQQEVYDPDGGWQYPTHCHTCHHGNGGLVSYPCPTRKVIIDELGYDPGIIHSVPET